MMGKMRCTYTELLEQPHEELQIFMAFAEGEAQAETDIMKTAQAKAG